MKKLKQWLAQPVRTRQVVIALACGFAFWLTFSAFSAFSAATGPGAADPMVDFGRLGAIFAAVLAPAGTELMKRWNLPRGLSPAVNGALAIGLYSVGWLLMTGGDASVLGAYLAEALAVAGVSTMGASALVSAQRNRKEARPHAANPTHLSDSPAGTFADD